MRLFRLILVSLIMLIANTVFGSEQDTFEITLTGKLCTETSGQSLSCEYRIGKDLHISIDGIGQPDTGITFMKSDIDGDFYATYGILHGCVIVKRGKRSISKDNPGLSFDYAFISPKNGKVYKDWGKCEVSY